MRRRRGRRAKGGCRSRQVAGALEERANPLLLGHQRVKLVRLDVSRRFVRPHLRDCISLDPPVRNARLCDKKCEMFCALCDIGRDGILMSLDTLGGGRIRLAESTTVIESSGP